MRLLYWGKDGGDESRVWGFWPIEIKSLLGGLFFFYDYFLDSRLPRFDLS